MANEPDGSDKPAGPGSADNLEVIRKLLQKLEEAASVDAGRGAERRPAAATSARPSLSAGTPRVPSQQAPPLQVLPQVAMPHPASSPTRPLEVAGRELSTLQRPGIPARVVPLELSTTDHRPLIAGPRASRRHTPVVAVLAFALGAVSAAAVAVYLGPSMQLLPGASQGSSKGRAPVGIDVAVAPPTGTVLPAVEPATAPAPNTSVAAVEPEVQPEIALEIRPDPQLANPAPVLAPPPTRETASSSDIAVAAAPAPAAAATPPPPPEPTAAPPPTLSLASRLQGLAGDSAPFPLLLRPAQHERDGRLVVLRGAPDWLTLSKGSSLGNGIWLIPAHFTADLVFQIADGASGSSAITIELATLDGQVLANARTTITATPQTAAPNYASAPISAQPLQPARLADDAVVQLLARADLLLDTGDLSAARNLYKAAAESGSAGGALKLGETYDPSELLRLGMTAGLADETVARRWYEQAQSLGSPHAADRLTALKQR